MAAERWCPHTLWTCAVVGAPLGRLSPQSGSSRTSLPLQATPVSRGDVSHGRMASSAKTSYTRPGSVASCREPAVGTLP